LAKGQLQDQTACSLCHGTADRLEAAHDLGAVRVQRDGGLAGQKREPQGLHRLKRICAGSERDRAGAWLRRGQSERVSVRRAAQRHFRQGGAGVRVQFGDAGVPPLAQAGPRLSFESADGRPLQGHR